MRSALGAVLLLLTPACGDDGGGSIVPDGRADGRGPPDGRPDVLPARDGPRPDARLADGGILDARVLDAGPDSGVLFLSDTTMGRIFALATDGSVVLSWDSPVSQPTGVAFDRRARDGLWVVGNGDPDTFYKIDFSGMTVDTLDNFWGVSGMTARGLDYYAAATSASDVLVNIHVNTTPVEGLSGTYVISGDGAFQSSHYMGEFLSGYWGVHMVDWAEPDPIRRWVVRSTTSRIERWNVASYETGFSAEIVDPRGLTMTPSGEFYVVDAGLDRVLRLGPSGADLGGFATPGTDPAGISYAVSE